MRDEGEKMSCRFVDVHWTRKTNEKKINFDLVEHHCAMATSYENPPRATQYQSTKRFDNLQADVNQVVDVMKDNLEKVLERDAKLSSLENRAENLQSGASQFTTNASRLKRKYWWKNVKMWIILIIVIIVLIIIIIVAITQSVKKN